MITRVFRVRIDPTRRDAFEQDFQTTSVRAVEGKDGFISASIGKPTKWTPDDYVMISTWRDEKALRAFAGEDWNRAVIPGGMEHYVIDCWVDHFQSFAE